MDRVAQRAAAAVSIANGEAYTINTFFRKSEGLIGRSGGTTVGKPPYTYSWWLPDGGSSLVAVEEPPSGSHHE